MKHGTYVAYAKHRCRCRDCADAYYRHAKDYRIRADYDQRKGGARILQRIDATACIEHLDRLLASGLTRPEVADLAGLPYQTIAHVHGHRPARVHRRTAAAILAVEPLPDLSDYVDPVVVDRLAAGGDWRTVGASKAERLAAADRLIAAGVSLARACDALGLNYSRTKGAAA